MQGFAQGAQIGKSSARALEAPRRDVIICVKRIDEDMLGLGQGAQIGKSCSRTLEAARHEIMTFI